MTEPTTPPSGARSPELMRALTQPGSVTPPAAAAAATAADAAARAALASSGGSSPAPRTVGERRRQREAERAQRRARSETPRGSTPSEDPRGRVASAWAGAAPSPRPSQFAGVEFLEVSTALQLGYLKPTAERPGDGAGPAT